MTHLPATLARLVSRAAPRTSAAAEPSTAAPVVARVGWYAGFALASVLILAAGMRLDRADLSAPFAYTGDAQFMLVLSSTVAEHGTHWRNPRLGAPGVQELHDFPISDHLHVAALWALGRATGSAVMAVNLYLLLTYPLTVLTAMGVLRHFALSVPAAGAGGLLYAFLPYHAFRGDQHLFLAAYYLVPLAAMVTLWVCRGTLPFFLQDADGRYRFAPFSGHTLVALLVAGLTASAGAYYAFFACALLCGAGLYGWAATATWRAPVSAGLVAAAVVVCGVANTAPSLLYQWANGKNAAAHRRAPFEAELHGLKLAHLLLPVAGHVVPPLAAIRAGYDAPNRLLQDENTGATLGAAGAVGLLGLLVVLLRPGARGWPLGPLAALAWGGVLLGTVGGFGALFAELVTPQIRGYNRVSVYVAFYSLFATVWVADQLLAGRPAWLRWAGLLGLAVVGVVDESGRPWFRSAVADHRDQAAAEFRADAAFFAEVERLIPGGTVFTLPYATFPENDRPHTLPAGYEHGRGVLHTRTVRWSFGAMKKREADAWQQEVILLPLDEMAERLAVRGFDAVFLDPRGLPATEAVATCAGLTAVLGPPVLTHADGRQVLFNLRPVRARLVATLGPEFDARRVRDEEAVRVLWLDGFQSFQPPGQEWRHRWCAKAGEVVFVNPSNRPRTVKMVMVARTAWESYADLRVTGSVWADRLPVNRDSPPIERTLTLPPGRHVVRFRCKPPADRPPAEWPEQVFSVAGFVLTELP